MQASYQTWLTQFIAACVLILGPELASAERPNVLFIAVDDLRVELGCYGHEHVRSPNIDRLASEGTLFQRAYCQQTVCNPSRASLLTGMRPDAIGIWDLPTHFRTKHPEITTLPQLFKRSGYHAQCIGKIFHNWRQDDWKGDAVSWSVPSEMHYNSHGNDKPKISGQLPENLASGKGGLECRDVPDDAYYDGRVANRAIDALERLSTSNEPFFLAVGFWKPHTPFNAPKKYWDMYARDAIVVPRHVTPPRDVPEIALTKDRYRGGADSEYLREMHHGHLAAITYLDAQIGKVLSKLDASGLRKNTIVVFWSDHGLHLGEHGLTRKTTAFELDAHVPLIISAPKYQRGRRTASLVELVDLYPTLAELCSLAVSPRLQGKSLIPILKDPNASVKQVAMTQTTRPNYLRGQPPSIMGYSMRTTRYRYTEWRDYRTGEIHARELYDHDADQLEMTNLAIRPSHEKIVSKLSGQLDAMLSESNTNPNP